MKARTKFRFVGWALLLGRHWLSIQRLVDDLTNWFYRVKSDCNLSILKAYLAKLYILRVFDFESRRGLPYLGPTVNHPIARTPSSVGHRDSPHVSLVDSTPCTQVDATSTLLFFPTFFQVTGPSMLKILKSRAVLLSASEFRPIGLVLVSSQSKGYLA
ncbi:hypothetical protein C8R45DRAFT_923553 [Mycena sanguinolenta]|nr:hypothetical protein C8R45DRAFT_923553 [Mycena sanguinolenta]